MDTQCPEIVLDPGVIQGQSTDGLGAGSLPDAGGMALRDDSGKIVLKGAVLPCRGKLITASVSVPKGR